LTRPLVAEVALYEVDLGNPTTAHHQQSMDLKQAQIDVALVQIVHHLWALEFSGDDRQVGLVVAVELE
jgi:hypothetical protein